MAEDMIIAHVIKEKQIMRKMMCAKREQLSRAEIRQAARAVAQPLKALLQNCFPPETKKPLQVAAYAAMRNEIDLAETWPLLLGYPCRLFFPAVAQGALALGAVPRGMMPQDWLKPGCLGILEPPLGGRCQVLPRLDLILVPGLAFDFSGRRIGWGKAYYDGLLARLSEHTICVGVGYDFQIVPQLPAAGHDQLLDVLLTPSGWLRCENQDRLDPQQKQKDSGYHIDTI